MTILELPNRDAVSQSITLAQNLKNLVLYASLWCIFVTPYGSCFTLGTLRKVTKESQKSSKISNISDAVQLDCFNDWSSMGFFFWISMRLFPPFTPNLWFIRVKSITRPTSPKSIIPILGVSIWNFQMFSTLEFKKFSYKPDRRTRSWSSPSFTFQLFDLKFDTTNGGFPLCSRFSSVAVRRKSPASKFTQYYGASVWFCLKRFEQLYTMHRSQLF